MHRRPLRVPREGAGEDCKQAHSTHSPTGAECLAECLEVGLDPVVVMGQCMSF
jgi:hypothetical protein